MTRSIHKLENERDGGRQWKITSDVSRIKSISLGFAIILRNMGRRSRSSTKLMIMYLICSNGLGRMLCQCTTLIYVDGLLKRLWMSLYTILSLQVTGCTPLKPNTISSRARWRRWEICDQFLWLCQKKLSLLKPDENEKKRLFRVPDFSVFVNRWFFQNCLRLNLLKLFVLHRLWRSAKQKIRRRSELRPISS